MPWFLNNLIAIWTKWLNSGHCTTSVRSMWSESRLVWCNYLFWKRFIAEYISELLKYFWQICLTITSILIDNLTMLIIQTETLYITSLSHKVIFFQLINENKITVSTVSECPFRFALSISNENKWKTTSKATKITIYITYHIIEYIKEKYFLSMICPPSKVYNQNVFFLFFVGFGLFKKTTCQS